MLKKLSPLLLAIFLNPSFTTNALTLSASDEYPAVLAIHSVGEICCPFSDGELTHDVNQLQNATGNLENATPHEPGGPSTALVQSEPAIWKIATEYPATSMPGEGLATFAEEVFIRTQGNISPRPTFEASSGFDSARMPAAVQDGKVQVGDTFGGALGELDPIFLLPSLPFVATSADEARHLADLARADYARAFGKLGQHLLYITPWPPTGLWSRRPVETLDDLKALSIRTYDETSAQVMQATGAVARNLSFTDAMPLLVDGSVNAVLSSGDGGAGRKLWNHLPYFTAIGYAMPLSFTTINAGTWQALTPMQQDAVTTAAQVTEDKQWARLDTRVAENAVRMRANGVTIHDNPTTEVHTALRDAGLKAVEAWQSRVGIDGRPYWKANSVRKRDSTTTDEPTTPPCPCVHFGPITATNGAP